MVCSTVCPRADSRKKSKPRVTGLCEENSPVTGEFPSPRASNADDVSIWWRHRAFLAEKYTGWLPGSNGPYFWKGVYVDIILNLL